MNETSDRVGVEDVVEDDEVLPTLVSLESESADAVRMRGLRRLSKTRVDEVDSGAYISLRW